jgi:Protein of unknown function (DUF2806)
MSDLLGIKGVAEATGTAVIKLIEACQVGMGGIFAPMQLRRMAKAEADVARIRAQGEADVEQIRARARVPTEKLLLQGQHELEVYRQSLEAKALPASTTSSDEPAIEVIWEDDTESQAVANKSLMMRTKGRFQYQEAKRQLNFEQIAGHAFNELPPDGIVSDEPVDPDWIARFFDYAKDVSRGDMQKLWGKILAGEVTQPRKFSLRTMEVLRNLSPSEAQLFQRYCQICTDDNEILVPVRHQEPVVSIDDLHQLVDGGLVYQTTAHGFAYPLHRDYNDPSPLGFRFGGKEIVATNKQTTHRLSGVKFSLTSSGKELRLLADADAAQDFFFVYLKELEELGFVLKAIEEREASTTTAPQNDEKSTS